MYAIAASGLHFQAIIEPKQLHIVFRTIVQGEGFSLAWL